jgi:cytochrome c
MKSFIPVALLAALAACQPAANPQKVALTRAPTRGNPVSGLEVADRNCSLCHAVVGGAASPHPRAPAFAALSTRYSLPALSDALSDGRVIGHTGMPQIELDPQKIKDLMAYLATIQKSSSTH